MPAKRAFLCLHIHPCLTAEKFPENTLQPLNSVKIVKFVEKTVQSAEKISNGSVESLRPSATRLCLSTPPKDSHQESLSHKEGSIAKSDR